MNNIQNPYQHNVDIIKGYFRKPVVLILAIAMTVSAVLQAVISFLGIDGITIDKIYKLFPTLTFELADKIKTASDISAIANSVNPFTVLIIISLFLFFFLSRSESKGLGAPTGIFKTVMLIQLILVCVAFALTLALDIILYIILINDYVTTSSTGAGVTFIFSAATIFIIIYFAFAIWVKTLSYRFANSINKSTKSIYLYKNGAKTIGVLNIIFAVLSFISVFLRIGSFIDGSLSIVTLANWLLGAVVSLLTGIFTFGYGSYIDKISLALHSPSYEPEENDNIPQQESAEIPAFQQIPVPPYTPNYEQEPIQDNPEPQQEAPEQVAAPEQNIQAPAPKFCSQCGNPLGENDYFCNNCGTRIR